MWKKIYKGILAAIGFCFGLIALPFLLVGESVKIRYKLITAFILAFGIVKWIGAPYWLAIFVGLFYSLFVLGVIALADEYKQNAENVDNRKLP